ncbi:MAG: cation transporting ATPase C-terminal domain-containing protein, partial [Oscillospiraceae bacterium]|nr:cation transporting ATPase C-terminal domain-containing protein [Oscillospiraceae bacterium]
LTLARLFHGFNCRSEQSIFKLGFSTNPSSIAAFVIGFVLLLLVMVVPFLSRLFAIAPLSMAQFGCIAALAFIPTLVIQLYRIIRKR